MNRLLIAFPVALATGIALAQEPAIPGVPAAKPAEQPATPAPRYQLKNKSAFNVPDNARTPFLPIGWVKRDAAAAPIVQQSNVDASGFRLTSILIGNPSLAVINGRSYEEGQYLRMPRSGPQVRIQLYRIGDGQVWLQMDGNLLAVPLKRPEIGEKKVEEQLLSEERDVVPQPATAPKASPATTTAR